MRECQRFLILDLVRHPVPLALFRVFVAPFLDRVNALDGATSVRRAFTAGEMREIAATLEGVGLPSEFHEGAAEVFSRLSALKDDPTSTIDDVLERLLTSRRRVRRPEPELGEENR